MYLHISYISVDNGQRAKSLKNRWKQPMFRPKPTTVYQPDIKTFLHTPDIMSCHPLVLLVSSILVPPSVVRIDDLYLDDWRVTDDLTTYLDDWRLTDELTTNILRTGVWLMNWRHILMTGVWLMNWRLKMRCLVLRSTGLGDERSNAGGKRSKWPASPRQYPWLGKKTKT